MMLPDELEWVLEMLGYRWPTANEDKLRDCATVWREFGEKVNELHTTANNSARRVAAHNAGASIDKFTKTYEKFDRQGGNGGYLRDAAEAAFLIANVLEACAHLVEFAKWAVIAQLIALAIEIAAAHAAAPFTFGLSEVAGLGATQVTRLIVRRLLDELRQALIEAIGETMKEPAISAIQAIITDLIRQTVNVGFGAQEGYDVGATIKAGGTAGLDALRQSQQTFAEGVRDSLGQKAGSRARHAIDGRIDGYDGLSGGDIGGDSGSGGTSSSPSSSGSSSSRSSSGPGSPVPDPATATRSGNDAVHGANIGSGVSADVGGSGLGAPPLGAGPDSDSGWGSDSGSPPSPDSPYSGPTPSQSAPSLSDFDDPSPGGNPPGAADSHGSSDTPSTSGPSHTGGGSPVSGLSSPTAQTAPRPSWSGGTSSSPGGGSIGTQIDGLAASAPTQSNAEPTPTTSAPSPAGTGGRSDGGPATPTSPTAPSTGGATPGTPHAPSASGGAPTTRSPAPDSGPARTPSAGTPGTPSATGTGPASTPSLTAPTTPRTPASTPDGRVPGTGDGRTPGAPDGRTPGADGRLPAQRPGSAMPGDGGMPRSTPGSTPGDRTPPRTSPGTTTPGAGPTPRNTTDSTSAPRTHAPGQNPGTTTPNRNPARSTHSTSTGTGPERAPTPDSGTPDSSPQPAPTTNPTLGTPGTPDQPSAGSAPTRPPQQPVGSLPSVPDQPGAQRDTQQPPTGPPNQQRQPQVIPVPVHHLIPAPNKQPRQSTPHPPGSPHQRDFSDNAKPKAAPAPASQTRNTNPPGGVTDPTRAEQDALENSVPRDENGDPTRPPNPADGRWVERINGEGRDAPGRNNNCVDVALSMVDTYAGNPTAAASRTPDLDADGNPSDRGERGGRDRIENTLGARFNDMGNGPDAFNRLEHTLRDSGHGSQAVIITRDAHGRAHAWNAVHHNGEITYIDAQTGRRSPRPLHSGNNGVFAIPLDPDRQPVTPGSDHHSRPAAAPNSDRPTPETPGIADRRPPEDPAGAGLEGDKSPERPRGSAEYDTVQSPGDTHYDMLPEPSQAHLRETNEVLQTDLEPVYDSLEKWGTRGDLRSLLHDGLAAEQAGIRKQTLMDALPGFGDMTEGQQGAVVAALARMDLRFHATSSVGIALDPDAGNPNSPTDFTPTTDDPEKAERSDKARETIQKLMDKAGIKSGGVHYHDRRDIPNRAGLEAAIADRIDDGQGLTDSEIENAVQEELKALEEHKGDWSRKNYAVVEVRDPENDNEIRYVVDSSLPMSQPWGSGVHSEPHAMDWIQSVNERRETAGRRPFEPVSLYTEREPCGHASGNDCSDYLAKEVEVGLPDDELGEGEKKNKLRIHYGVGFRRGAIDDDADLIRDDGTTMTPAEAKDEARAMFKADFNTYVNRLKGMWESNATSGQ
jgi:hypothetical protein